MAACKNCGKAVGCGCGLKGGLCATCANEANKVQVTPPLLPPAPTIK
jgi:hypothetical protein